MATDYVQVAAGAAGSFVNALYWAVLVCLVLGTIFFIIYWFSFKVEVNLRYKTKGPHQVLRKKGKYSTDRDGMEKLVVRFNLFKRIAFKMPPPDAIQIGKKGKHALDIELSGDGRHRYLTINSDEGNFEPFDSDDRAFQIHEGEKRVMRRKKTLGEIIMAMAPLIAVIIIVVSFLAFFGDVVKPVTDAANSIQAHEEKMWDKMNENQRLMNEILQKEQIIRQQTIDGAVQKIQEGEVPPE